MFCFDGMFERAVILHYRIRVQIYRDSAINTTFGLIICFLPKLERGHPPILPDVQRFHGARHSARQYIAGHARGRLLLLLLRRRLRKRGKSLLPVTQGTERHVCATTIKAALVRKKGH